jgi:hypothetical protein
MTMRTLLASLAIGVSLFSAAHASPQHAVGVWCNKAEQVETLFRWVIIGDMKLDEGLKKINAPEPTEFEPPRGSSFVCAVAQIMFVPGDEVKRVEHAGKVYGIFAVAVLAISIDDSYVAVFPTRLYGFKQLVDDDTPA